MKRVLYVGQDPDTVDFSDPSLPPGTDAVKIKAGIERAAQALSARGWRADLCMISPDDAGIAMLMRMLDATDYDCAVIGGGLRMPPKTVPLFERVVNAIIAASPRTRLAFNTGPDDTADAAARWL